MKSNTNTYQIEGTRRLNGAIGVPENFKVKEDATSSHNAYVQVRDAIYNNGYESVNVIAIKMRCENCGKFHLVVPPDLYL